MYTKLNVKELTTEYNKNKSPRRELYKYLFSIATFGLGALYLWLTTIVIKQGYIGIREDARGYMILLPPGRHSNFPWEIYPEGPKSLANEIIELGPYKIISVESGYVAKTLNQGKLEIINVGYHLINDASHTFNGFIPIKQETRSLEPVTAATQDNVAVTLQADVIYKIDQPQTALLQVDNIEQTISEISKIHISQVISHHRLSELAPVSTIRQDQTVVLEHTGTARGFGQLVSELLQSLKLNLQNLGIDLINIGIKSWYINDQNLAHELAQGAVLQSQTSSRILTAERDAEIKKINAEADKQAIILAAQANAESLVIEAEAKYNAALKEADAIVKSAERFGSDQKTTFMYNLQSQQKIVASAKNSTLFYTGQGHQQQPMLVQDVIPRP